MFLRHEGFLGALGAFMSYEKHGLDVLMAHQLVERFPMGAPYTGGKIHGPPLGDLNEKASIVRVGQYSKCFGPLIGLCFGLILWDWPIFWAYFKGLRPKCSKKDGKKHAVF